MQRSFRVGAIEVVAPLVAAVVAGLVLFFAFAPRATEGQSANPNRVRIYTSVPMNDYASIVHGVQMAIDEAGGKAGGFDVELVPLNDAPALGGKWSADVELANARRAVEDPDAMVYIGTYNSGAAKVSIPVLNRVNMAMISPGNTYPGLTKPGSGDAGEPFNYYPLGTRNYFRVVPADDLQGSAAAAYAKQIGVKSVYVLDDTELYGHGIAKIFAESAASFGIKVLGGPEGIDVRTTNYDELVAKIVAAGPDLVYFGGITANHPGNVVAFLSGAGYSGAFMGADGIVNDDFLAQTRNSGLAVYATLVGLPAAEMSGAGADWYRSYKQKYPDDSNEDFAPFGYEAGRVALHAIASANRKDRDAIRAAVAATTSADLQGQPILGDWKFDANGDTSLVNISILQESSVNASPWRYLGLMVYDANAKAWTLQEAGR